MQNPNNIKRWLKYFIVVLAIVYMGLVAMFIYFFRSSPISQSPSDWNDTSGFFGNIATIIISLLSIVVSIYVAFEIQNYANTNSSKEINTQKIIAKVSFQKEELDLFGNRITELFEIYHRSVGLMLYGSDIELDRENEVDEKFVKNELLNLKNGVLRTYKDLITRGAALFSFSDEFDYHWAEINFENALKALEQKDYIDIFILVSDVRVGFGRLLNILRHQMLNQLSS